MPTSTIASVPVSAPPRPRPLSGLDAYTGEWDWAEAAHLLRRTLFGAKKAEIETAIDLGLEATVSQLLADQDLPDPPVNYRYDTDPNTPIGESWVAAPVAMGVNGYQRTTMLIWWTDLMIHQNISLREKMTLFWHNHFAVQMTTVGAAKPGYVYNNLIRTQALGNFKELVKEMTINPAMLRFLNGNENRAVAPNENYARELFELFTIGKGPQIAPGDYTYYTEDDVLAAARVLTGWRDRISPEDDGGLSTSTFMNAWHTSGSKQFSDKFNNTVIAQNGNEEYADLVDMIFEQAETARYICRKLYRWFVYYQIDDGIEADIIQPMADILIDNNFEIKPVLEALFKSEHFYEELIRGALIKNPVDFVLGIARQFEVDLPSDDLPLETYLNRYFRAISVYVEEMFAEQMLIHSPPSVAGWSPYYQEPQFHEGWINAVTLSKKRTFIETMTGTGFTTGGGFVLVINPLTLLNQLTLEEADDVNVMIDRFVAILLPRPITANQTAYLKAAILPGLPDFTWSNEYGNYYANPDSADASAPVVARLKALLNALMSLAEYQLS